MSKLSQNGVAGFLLANGALSESGVEQSIRTVLIEKDLVEAIVILPRNLFYTTDISVTLWILNRNKHARVLRNADRVRKLRDRSGEVMFMDLRQMGTPYEKKYLELGDEERLKVTATFHAWREDDGDYSDIPEFCYSASRDEIESKEYTLVPSRYIEFKAREEEVDFDEKMNEIRSGLSAAIEEGDAAKKQLLAILEELGYGI